MTAMTQNSANLKHNILNATVMVASLGYFVDMFDMFLFNVLRVRSLTDLGYSGIGLTEAGLLISSAQFGGFLFGAWICGTLADRLGRKKALYVSILLYATGSLLSAGVWDAHSYAIARFITGLGLAGELGAGITLIAETLRADRRGTGSLVFAAMGLCGVMTASAIAGILPWRLAYGIGGILGLLLLITRMRLSESGLYASQAAGIHRGGLRAIFGDKPCLATFLSALLIMVPAVFTPQIVWTLSPEIAASAGIVGVQANIMIGLGFAAALAGEILAIGLSEFLRSRKKAALLFLLSGLAVFTTFILNPPATAPGFYVVGALMGLTFGGWVIGSIWAAEQFGTNIRATAVTTIPNFARALTIPMNIAYAKLQHEGALSAAAIIGFTVMLLALIGWRNLRETYGRDLDFSEEIGYKPPHESPFPQEPAR